MWHAQDLRKTKHPKVAYLFRLESTKKEEEMDLKGREYKSVEWHLSG